MAVNADEDERTDDGDGEEIRGSGENLDLVSSELCSLSKNWLAALKDHALLSLPQGRS